MPYGITDNIRLVWVQMSAMVNFGLEGQVSGGWANVRDAFNWALESLRIMGPPVDTSAARRSLVPVGRRHIALN